MRDIKKIEEVDELILLFCNLTLDFLKLTLLYKTFKITRLAIVDYIILNHINIELLKVNIQKKQQVQYTAIQYNGQTACVLSMKDMKKRKKLANSKKKREKS